MPRSTTPLRLLAAGALLLGSSLAQAQYSWIGENGVRHFSDRPPPPSTPAHKILKTPGRMATTPPAPEASAAAPAAPKAAPTLAEREADYKERKKKREEQEKKDAQQAERERDIAQRCAMARSARAQVESGVRIRDFDAAGQSRIMTDEERAAQFAQANKILAECR